jgi:hypothetical protein
MEEKVATIEQFDAAVCKNLRPVIEQALNKALKQSGLTATLGSIRFTETSFDVKVEVKAGNDGRVRYEFYSQPEGLKKDWFGKPFAHRGQTLRISGWNEGRKSSTHPVQVTDDKGQTLLLSVQAVKNAFLEPDEAAREREATLRKNWKLEFWMHDLFENWLGQEFKGGSETRVIAGLEKVGRKTYVVLKKADGTFGYLEVKNFLNIANSTPNKHLQKNAAA